MGLPCSSVMIRARSSRASEMSVNHLRRTVARSCGSSPAQPGKAAEAASTAARDSAPLNAGIEPIVAPVAGSVTAIAAWPTASMPIRSPSMKEAAQKSSGSERVTPRSPKSDRLVAAFIMTCRGDGMNFLPPQ